MFTTIRQTYDLLGRDRRGRWLLLAFLALLVSGAEMVVAVLVYTLLALVSNPGEAIDLPVLGDVRSLAGDMDETTLLLSVLGAMAAFFILRGILKIAVSYARARIVHNAGAHLASRLVEGYLSWPYAVHLRRTSSELIRNAHQATQEVISSVVMPLIRLAAELVLVAGMLTVLIWITPGATALAVLVIGSVSIVLLLIVQPRLKRIGQTYHRESQFTLKSLQQSLHGIRDIKILGAEVHFAREYGRSRLKMARSRYLQALVAQLPPVIIETALFGFIISFFAIAIIQGGAAQETLSVLGLFGYVGLRLLPSLQQIIQGLNNLKYASAPVADLHADLWSVEELTPRSQPVDPLPFNEELVVQDLVFRYEGTDEDVLRSVNLRLQPGMQLGICGPTGGGKTTLIDVISGLLEPTSGTVLVDGKSIHDWPREWQRNLGIVPQMVFLLDDSVRRNIALGLPDSSIDNDALYEALELAQLGAFVRSLPDGLDTVVGERGIRVSGGQRQRIAIARALYRRPSVLIFDEGTSALDNATEALLMEAIERLRKSHTVILIAHRLSTVRNCDLVAFIEEGSVTGLGSYDELMEVNSAFRTMASSA